MKHFLLFVSFCFLFFPTLKAQTDYDSFDNQLGDWSDNATWQGGTAPSNTPGLGVGTMDINGKVTRNGSLTLWNNAVLSVSDTLLVTGNINLAGNSDIVIQSGGVLIILGNLTGLGGNVSSNDGKVVVGGNLTLTLGSDVDNSTDFYVQGAVTTGFFSSVTGNPLGDATDLVNNDPDLFDLFIDGTLPVTWLYAMGGFENGRVLIDFATASEENNDFFTIERSANGQEFEEIGTVEGSGTTNLTSSYLFEDPYPISGIVYYRIKQTDYDGQFAYSEVFSVDLRDIEPTVLMELFPNPSSSIINIRSSGLDVNSSSLTLYNSRGMPVQTFNQIPQQLDISLLNNGLYVVEVKCGNKSIRERLIKR